MFPHVSNAACDETAPFKKESHWAALSVALMTLVGVKIPPEALISCCTLTKVLANPAYPTAVRLAEAPSFPRSTPEHARLLGRGSFRGEIATNRECRFGCVGRHGCSAEGRSAMAEEASEIRRCRYLDGVARKVARWWGRTLAMGARFRGERLTRPQAFGHAEVGPGAVVGGGIVRLHDEIARRAGKSERFLSGDVASRVEGGGVGHQLERSIGDERSSEIDGHARSGNQRRHGDGHENEGGASLMVVAVSREASEGIQRDALVRGRRDRARSVSVSSPFRCRHETDLLIGPTMDDLLDFPCGAMSTVRSQLPDVNSGLRRFQGI